MSKPKNVTKIRKIIKVKGPVSVKQVNMLIDQGFWVQIQ